MKKVLKIIIGILVALLLIFLLTGLIVKETTYETSITINKPIASVFTAFNDATTLKERMPSIQSFEPISETPQKVGSTYKMIVVDDNGNEFEMLETVIAFEENKRVTLEFDVQSMLKTDDFQFSSDGTTTTITNNVSCKGTSYLYKCMFPYFKGMFKNIDQENLDNFKKFIEK